MTLSITPPLPDLTNLKVISILTRLGKDVEVETFHSFSEYLKEKTHPSREIRFYKRNPDFSFPRFRTRHFFDREKRKKKKKRKGKEEKEKMQRLVYVNYYFARGGI